MKLKNIWNRLLKSYTFNFFAISGFCDLKIAYDVINIIIYECSNEPFKMDGATMEYIAFVLTPDTITLYMIKAIILSCVLIIELLFKLKIEDNEITNSKFYIGFLIIPLIIEFIALFPQLLDWTITIIACLL